MTKNNERFLHGLHNEAVCQLLAQQEDYPDWVIITAFYASLHFVSFKLFPFSIRLRDGSSLLIDDIKQWQQLKNYTSNKRHVLLKDLVSKYCSAIEYNYDWLLSYSIIARYEQYQQDRLIADKAVRLMKEIKRECEGQRGASDEGE